MAWLVRARLIRRPLALKLAVAAALIVLLSSGLIGYFTAEANYRLHSREVSARLEHGTAMAVRELVAHLQAASREVITLTETPSLRELVRALDHGGRDPVSGQTLGQAKERTTGLLEAVLRSHPLYFQARVIGVADEGRELIRVDSREGKVERAPDHALQRKGHRPYFEAAISMPPGRAFYSAINLNREHRRISQPRTPTIRIARPLFGGDGAPVGIVIINVDIGRIFGHLENQLAAPLSLYIANAEGHLLHHPDRSRTFGFETGRNMRIQDEFGPALARMMDDPKRRSLLVGEEGGIGPGIRDFVPGIAYITNDCPDLGYFVRTRAGKEEGAPDVVVGTVFATSGITAEMNREHTNTVFLVLKVVIGFTLLAIVFSHHLSLPLGRLATAVAGYTGEGPILLERATKRSDEIGILARSVAEMTHQIATDMRRLEEDEARLSQLLDVLVDGVVVIDQRGHVEIINPAAERLLGYEANELLGRNIKIIVPEPHRSRHDDYLRRYLETGRRNILGGSLETTAVRKDGSEIPIYLSVTSFTIAGERRFAGILHDISDQKNLEEELRRQANTDPLTGLLNRRCFTDHNRREMERNRRYGAALSLVLIDIDHFKKVNDTYGHGAGDDVIRGVAAACMAELRDTDFMGRIGGEEFAVLLPDSDLEAAGILAERLRARVAEVSFATGVGPVDVTVSVGVTEVDEAVDDVRSLTHRADVALYRAKEEGRNRVVVLDADAPV